MKRPGFRALALPAPLLSRRASQPCLSSLPFSPPTRALVARRMRLKPLQFPSFVLAAGLILTSPSGPQASAQEAAQLDEGQRQALTSQKRDETIEQLRRIIPKIDDRSAQKADLLYQLAELYVEKSKQLL